MKIYIKINSASIKTISPGDLFISKGRFIVLCLKKQVSGKNTVITWFYQSNQFSTEIYNSNYANTI